MSNKSLQWSDSARVDCVALEPDRLFMFRSVLSKGRSYFHEYAYFLVRPDGNCLFHGPDAARFYRSQRGFFDAHGGIALQMCSHAGDLSDASALIEDIWGAPPYVSRWGAVAELERKRRRARAKAKGGVEP